MKASNFKLTLIIACCFMVLILLMVAAGKNNNKAKHQTDNSLLVNTNVEVSRLNIQPQYLRKRSIFGQVQSEQLVDLAFEQTGALESLLIEEGDRVEKNQLLAKLDKKRLNARQQELNASLKRAKADSRLTKLSQDRIKNLVDKGLESNQALDEANARYESSIALTEEIQAQLNSLEIETEKSELRSPFSGQIITQFADIGAVVNSGQTIYQLLNNENLEVKFGLPQQTAFNLNEAKHVKLFFDNDEISAQLKTIEANRGAATRTIDAIFTIYPDDNLAIVSGDLIRLEVYLPKEIDGAWIPISALTSSVRGLWSLFVLDPETNTINNRMVSVEHIESEFAYVRGAIKDNEIYVINGVHRLASGQKVNKPSYVELNRTSTHLKEI